MVDLYGLDPLFERIVAELCAVRSQFWGRIGKDIDPERIGDPDAKLALQIARSVAYETKNAPSSAPVLIQRAQRWHAQGKLSADALGSVRELFLDAIDDGEGFDGDMIATELAPVLRRELEKAALEVGYDHFAKRKDMGQVEAMLAKAKRIGSVDLSQGSRLGSSIVQGIVQRASYTRRPFGVRELDSALGGGQRRGTYCVISGSTGAGKSMFCDHAVAEHVSFGWACAVATLELSEDDHHARIIGNLVDLPYDDILRYPDVALESEKRLRVLEEDGLLGFCTVKMFTARSTTVADIDEWLDIEEQIAGRKIETVVVDYGTLLSDPEKKVRHEEMSSIAEQLRTLAVTRDVFLMVPNQANAEGMNSGKTKRLENHHSADSKGIPKTCDLHITLNPRDDGETLMFYVAKNRHGASGEEVGPLPVEFEKGRIAPAIREGWPF